MSEQHSSIKKFSFTPSGVCCRQITLEIEDSTLQSVEFINGCQGNLAGISRLVAGRDIDSIITTLEGIDCRGKGTSCPDQLARALRTYKAQQQCSKH